MSAVLDVALQFLSLSLIAVGGVTGVLPEVYRRAVDVRGWLTSAQFRDLFAISQAAPGPNMLLMSLIGQRVAGVPGALVATLGMCGPSCTLAYFVSGAWERFRGARWRAIVQAGLAPVAVGLILATGWVIAGSGHPGWTSWGVVAASAALVARTRVNPLWLLAGAGALGLAGLV